MKNPNKAQQEQNLYWVEKMVGLMDSKFRIPGTNFRFGLDPIFGLLPVIGDLTSFAISGGLILYMIKFGASRKVVFLMLINITLDATFGSIPILGHIFDFFYKANTRNINLLKRHYQEGKYHGSGNGILALALLTIISLLFLMLWACWEAITWLIAHF